MNWLVLGGFGLASAAVAFAATGLLLPVLRERQIVDHPNARSSHSLPTPRGGGLAILLAVLPGWCSLWFLSDGPVGVPAIIAGALLVA